MDNMYDILEKMTLLEGRAKNQRNMFVDQVTKYEFKGKTYEQQHGNPFDRGFADSYYGRPRDPHCYPEGTYKGEKVVLKPGTAEYEAYMAGYDYNEQFGDKKKVEESLLPGFDEAVDPEAFAALAPPRDKITFADKIAGAKKEVDEMLGDVAAEAMKKAVHGMAEDDMEEGNDFTGARLAAIRAGKPTFSVGGKTFRVTGDTSDEKQMMEKTGKKEKVLWPGTPEYEKRFPKTMKPGEKARSSTGGEIEKTATGIKHTAKSHDDEDEKDTKADDGAPKKKGRPKGSKHATGAKVKGTSKLHRKPSIKEEDPNRGEYDREGEMAKGQSRTIADAAHELQRMLGDDENLPEWVQKKIAIAQEYIDAARDYLKANRPSDDGEEAIAEKAVSKAQQRFMGMVHAAQKGEKPASKEVAKVAKEMPKKAAKDYAKTKHAGLPEKVKAKKEESKEEVEETTVAGSVATAPAAAPKGKKGMVFGKGVYESKLEESYKSRLEKMLTEGMSINASQSEDGNKTLSVTATDDDAMKLAQILQLAGMEQAHGYEEACSACGQAPCGCEQGLEEADLANAPEPVYADTEVINNQGDDLHKRKNTGQATLPTIYRGLDRQNSLGRVYEEVREDAERKLWDLYKKYENK